jgi:hypothetical protein
MAIATYDELTFTYNLTIDPVTNKATLQENHVIGRVRDLWHFWGWFILPLYNHYNSTGTFRYGHRVGDATVYQFLEKNHIQMSIVNFQTSIMADRNTYSRSASGQNVTDNEVAVSDSAISTYADDGEKIFDASFGTKKTYDLYNYTAYPAENVSDTYDAITRTAKIDGYAKNAGLFVYHIGLMKFMPYLVANMYPALFQKALTTISNMTKTNYFYLISYPTYSGFRVEHDPTFTVYLSTSSPATFYPYLLPALIISVVAIGAILVVVLLRLRKPRQQSTTTATQSPKYQSTT